MVSLLLLSALTPGCGRADPRFGGWRAFASRFAARDGRIIDTGNGGISHSEGQGYGMILAEAAGDRAGFDRIWGWASHVLARPDMRLFRWRYDPAAAQPVSDSNNASDGDMLIAWALLRAAKRWPTANYAAQSAAIRSAIVQKLVIQFGGRTILIPGLDGFRGLDRTTINPSYYIWPALDAFAAADPGAWDRLLRDGERIMEEARFGPALVTTDWIDVHAGGALTPAAGRPPRFGFDAIRVPLYLAWSGRGAALQSYRSLWKLYLKLGHRIPAWVDVLNGEVAPYPLSAGEMNIVSLTLGDQLRDHGGAQDYYSSVLTELSYLARQQN